MLHNYPYQLVITDILQMSFYYLAVTPLLPCCSCSLKYFLHWSKARISCACTRSRLFWHKELNIFSTKHFGKNMNITQWSGVSGWCVFNSFGDNKSTAQGNKLIQVADWLASPVRRSNSFLVLVDEKFSVDILQVEFLYATLVNCHHRSTGHFTFNYA